MRSITALSLAITLLISTCLMILIFNLIDFTCKTTVQFCPVDFFKLRNECMPHSRGENKGLKKLKLPANCFISFPKLFNFQQEISADCAQNAIFVGKIRCCSEYKTKILFPQKPLLNC